MAVWSVVNNSLVNHHSGRIDAEYYKTESLQAYDYVKKGNYKLLGQLAKEGYRVVYENTKILKPEKVDEQRDVRFLQATNVSDDGLWIEPKEIGFVSGKDWGKYPKGRIKHGELLIEVKGQAEKVTIVQDYMPMRTLVTGTLYKLTVDEKKVSPEYIFAYFSCKYGKILRDRTKVNTLISYVSKPELYNIPIPIFEESIDEISSIIRESYRLSALSHSLYHQAETILAQELQLDQLKLPNKKWYTTDYCEVIGNGRCDGEYYQPKYKKLMQHLSKFNCRSLGSLCDFIKGFEIGSSSYKDHGKLFMRVSNISENGIQMSNSDKHISDSDFQRLKPFQIEKGDVLCTKDGTIAMCYVIDEDIEGIYSSGIVKLSLNKDIPAEYLAIVINSVFGKMQANRDCSGALITHWKIGSMKKIQIPIISDASMNSIADFVCQSKAAKRQSKQLLSQAKHRVEELIEQEANKYK